MKTKASCCGGQHLRREWRTTWLHRWAKLLQYSPWECPLCRRVRLVSDKYMVQRGHGAIARKATPAPASAL